MQHPDEGTIHAWLDGALDEAEARRIAEHVATCAECEARVVEARGLIAGASRVLSALDAVPAGVTPSARSAEPDESAPPRERPDERTRHWWRRRGVSPALAAAAAVAFVAVGSAVVLRERGATAPAYERVQLVDTAPAAAPMVAAPTPPIAAGGASVSSSAPAPGSPSPAGASAAGSGAASAKGPATTAAPAVVATVTPPRRETETRQRAEAKAMAPDRRSEPVPAPRPTADALTTRRGLAASAAAGASAAPAPPSTAEGARPAAGADVVPRKGVRPTADSIDRANRMRSMQLEQVVVTGVVSAPRDANAPEAALRRATPRSAAPDSLAAPRRGFVAGDFPGCYEIEDRDVARLPRRFVLDTALAIEIVSDSAAGRSPSPLVKTYRARSLDPDRPLQGSWRALGPVAQVAWREGSDVLALQIRAGSAPRWAARLTVGDSIRTVILQRCEE